VYIRITILHLTIGLLMDTVMEPVVFAGFQSNVTGTQYVRIPCMVNVYYKESLHPQDTENPQTTPAPSTVNVGPHTVTVRNAET